jgi:hypothetical protein
MMRPTFMVSFLNLPNFIAIKHFNKMRMRGTSKGHKSRQIVYIVKEMTENTPPSWVGGYLTNCLLLFLLL